MSSHGMEHQRSSRSGSSVKGDGSFKQLIRPEYLPKYAGSSRREIDEDEELKWAAMEKLPTYDRLRTTVIGKGSKNDRSRQVDLTEVGYSEHRRIIEKLFNLNLEEDNEKLLSKLRNRLDTVGIQQPTVEVRYENLEIDAMCHVGVRALPTLYNSAMNVIDAVLELIGLSVTKKTELKILSDVSGILKPGRMTLLLGPPTSGKTTLLLALSSKLAPGLNFKGRVTFNGYSMDEFVPNKTCTYISQHDEHMGELTVRETLNFSARYQGVGSRYELLTELLKREKELGIHPEGDIDFFMKASALNDVAHEIITEYTMKILSLDVCADTMVGDEMRRGISGGQKKRVTIGEMIVGPVNTLFMDEISTGLDSSTTFQIIKCFSQITRYLQSTMLISLLQPAPETFNMFDDIILLSEGKIVYHGPRENVVEFFEHCGFRCPERKGIGDFLQEVTSPKDQEQYWADKRKPYEYIPVSVFAENFKKFHVGERMYQELGIPYDKCKSHKAALMFQKWTLPKWDLFKITFDRELLVTKRNAAVHVVRVLQITLSGLLDMSLFFRTRMHRKNFVDAQVYNGALFFGLSTMLFTSYADIPFTIARFPVFFKQRDLRFYPAWTFTTGLAAMRLPSSIIEAFLFTSITYYTIGFAPAVGRFFRQYLTYMLAHQMATSLFRMISGLCRTMVIADCFGAFSLLVMFVEGGFVLPRTIVKPWWKWAYFISPMMYGQQALSVNEFLAPQWRKPTPGMSSTLGLAFLKYQGYYARGFWFWLSVGVLLFNVIFMNVVFTLALAYLRGPGRPQAVISEESLAQKKSAQGQLSLDESRGLKSSTPSKRSLPRSIFGSQSRGSTSLSPERANKDTIDDSDLYVLNTRISETNSNKNSRSRSSSSLGLAARDSLDLQRLDNRKRGMVLPFQPLAIAFNDINYFVDMPAEMKQEQGLTGTRLQLLRQISGAFRPGVLTALVGVTGAGKSTLLDVLAGRKTKGYIEGDIYISGFPKNQKTFARISGYCEQNDIHSPQLTVHESLLFSARLRLPADIDKASKETFVREVMDLVELTVAKDALVGNPGVTGLSTEQRKRLTIAVELVANPSIIFMDEPTSGLDARSAAIVMRTVRNTVDTGRTVVCTIHQPSIDIFESFDELLLLKRGGELVYAGPLGRHSHKLVEYFEAIHGVPKIVEGYNPATWMLEVTSPNTEKKLGVDFAQIYQASLLYDQNKALVKELSSPSPNAQVLSFPTQYAQPVWNQIYHCLWKQNLTYYRSPEYNNVRCLFITISAIFFGTEYLHIGHNRGSQKDLLAIMGAVYSSILFLGVQNASTVQPVVSGERTVFYRERAAGMYSSMPYALSQVLIEIPYLFVESIIYSLITYSMIGLQWKASKFLWYFYFVFFSLLYWIYFGMLGVAVTPNQTLSALVAGFWYNCWNIFAGFTLPKPHIPIWWTWFYRACPLGWTIYGVIISQFGDMTDVYTSLPDGSRISVAHYVEHYLGYRNNFLHACAGILLIFPVLFATCFILAIKHINYQNR